MTMLYVRMPAVCICSWGMQMCCHMQPAEEPDWATSPFDMCAVDGYLCGRGTSDNKGPVLAFIYAVKVGAGRQGGRGRHLRAGRGSDLGLLLSQQAFLQGGSWCLPSRDVKCLAGRCAGWGVSRVLCLHTPSSSLLASMHHLFSRESPARRQRGCCEPLLAASRLWLHTFGCQDHSCIN